MRFALPATRTLAYLCGGAVAVIAIYVVVGNAIEAAVDWKPGPWVETGIKIVFFTLVVLVMCLIWALMIRSLIGFQVAFWMRVAAARRSRGIADNVARIAPPVRRIGDVIILAGWALWVFGLSVMVPVMIRDGFFS